MLKPVTSAFARSIASSAVEIVGLATAVPQHRISQDEASAEAKRLFPHLTELDSIYASTGIAHRYSCEPLAWFGQPHGWEERTETFQRHALSLLEDVAVRTAADAGIKLKDFDALVVNTVTGLAVPSLDAKLMNHLDLSPSIERLPIFGLGCGAGIGGLARAARYAEARVDSRVLFLTVDLCTLCFRSTDPSRAMFVAAALFGDGAAGVALCNRPSGDRGRAARGRIVATGEHFWRGTEHIMGWDIKQDGFGIVLSPELPQLVRTQFEPALHAFLDRSGTNLGEIDGFIIHPGGAKILNTLQEALDLERDDLVHSWEVLRDFGNMSSPTVLFALAHALAGGATGRHLLAAFGPGFSAYFAIVDL